MPITSSESSRSGAEGALAIGIRKPDDLVVVLEVRAHQYVLIAVAVQIGDGDHLTSSRGRRNGFRRTEVAWLIEVFQPDHRFGPVQRDKQVQVAVVVRVAQSDGFRTVLVKIQGNLRPERPAAQIGEPGERIIQSRGDDNVRTAVVVEVTGL